MKRGKEEEIIVNIPDSHSKITCPGREFSEEISSNFFSLYMALTKLTTPVLMACIFKNTLT